MSPRPGPSRFFHRPLAWMVDLSLGISLGALYNAFASPWLRTVRDDLPWPLSLWVPYAVGLAPFVLVLLLIGVRDLGRWRRSLGLALMRLGVETQEGGVPSRRQMVERRLGTWLLLGLGSLPALLRRPAFQDRVSGTRVVRRGAPRTWVACGLVLLAPLSAWGSRWWQGRPEPQHVLRWGYLDRKTGEVVIPPRFQTATPFRDGYAVVRLNGGWRWIDASGAPLAELGGWDTFLLQVQGLALFSHQRTEHALLDIGGNVLVRTEGEVLPAREHGQPTGYRELGGRAYYLNADGRRLTERDFDEVWPFVEGLARVKAGGKMGILDAGGTFRAPLELDEIGPLEGGMAPARQGKTWGILGTEGQGWVVPPTFEAVGGVDKAWPDLTPAKRDGHWGYLRRDGNWALAPTFEEAKGFTPKGWARVKQGGRWGVIDTSGAWVLTPRFEEVAAPREAPFAFRQGVSWGYVVPGGRILVAPIFQQAGAFREGVAFARGLSRWFRLEANGHLAPLPFGWILPDEESLEASPQPFAQREVKR